MPKLWQNIEKLGHGVLWGVGGGGGGGYRFQVRNRNLVVKIMYVLHNDDEHLKVKVVKYVCTRVSEYVSITLRFFTIFLFDSNFNFNQNMRKVHYPLNTHKVLLILQVLVTVLWLLWLKNTCVSSKIRNSSFVKRLQIKSICQIIFLHLTATQNGRRLLIFVEKCQRLGWGGGGASTEQGTTATSCVTHLWCQVPTRFWCQIEHVKLWQNQIHFYMVSQSASILFGEKMSAKKTLFIVHH